MYLNAVIVLFFYSNFYSMASGKTVTGVFRSDAAREHNGQYITKFLFHGDNALMVYRLEDVSTAVQKEARLLLFQNLEGLDSLSCAEYISSAKISITLSAEEHNQTIPTTAAPPRLWHIVYADRDTCQEGDGSGGGDLRFQIVLLNPDSEGNPLDHFSAEQAGLLGFYLAVVLAYLAAACIYARPLWQALLRGGPMLAVLKVLSLAVMLQAGSALSNYVHLSRFAGDGLGMPWMGSLAEICDAASQVQMLSMLLSLCAGWTLSKTRKPQKPLQWDASPASTALALGGGAVQGALLLWEQFEDTDHHSFHTHRSVAGVLLLALRVGLALLLASILYQMIAGERSTIRRDFYLGFAKGSVLWFLCHPVLVLLSAIFNEHQREKVVTVGVILCQSISVVILYQLFLCRNFYWEVSALSSISLPLTMSRGLQSSH
ncbi:integral membrane protein GPR180-like isoform X1 [Brienomyrus brachyistius]|uniref:integral membrane protein GPR180-like isoform X1 n=1 Tax=Brienomyrus brachyistius TaxID=42636 RepID=UPI0020B23CD7|nr:integral membrane protein GPR180-like isoform X1 [Brienomyrus brachyistius]